MNAVAIQTQGALGMMLVGFSMMNMKENPRNFLMGLSTAIGSAGMISSFYQTHTIQKTRRNIQLFEYCYECVYDVIFNWSKYLICNEAVQANGFLSYASK